MSARSIRRSHDRGLARSRRRTRRAAIGAAIGATALFTPAASAAEVNTLDDTVSDGDCDADCTLRDAVDSTNASATDDTITFQSGLNGETRPATTLVINDDLSIQGPGAAQAAVSGDANNDDIRDFGTDVRILRVTPPGTIPQLRDVSISGLTLREGVAQASDAYGNGGAILAQGTALTLAGVVLSDNLAAARGGGVLHQSGTLDMSDSQVFGNQAYVGGGGLVSGSYGFDPGISITDSSFTDNRAGRDAPPTPYGYPAGGGLTVNGGGVIRNVTIANNTATETFGSGDPKGFGGGASIDGSNGELTLESSSITANSSGRSGGGLSVNGATVVDTTISGNQSANGGGVDADASVLRGTTISGNTAGTGGGIYLEAGDGNTTIRNSTVSGNQAVGGLGYYPGTGGGIFAYGDAKYASTGPSLVRLRTSTVAANSAAVRGGNAYAVYDGDGLDEPFVELRGTIVADGSAPAGPDLAEGDAGAFNAGFSLIESPGGIPLTGEPAGSNITGVDPQLGPLADNGGPTRTHAPAPTSVAIDAGLAFGSAQDQRGQARTVDAAATNSTLTDGTDIGALELGDATATGDDDVTAPNTKLTKKPKKKLKAKGRKKLAKAKYGFTGSDGSAGPLSFECKLDKGRFEPCESPLKEKLDAGKHVFLVRAVDAAGNVDPTPARSKTKVKRKKKK